MGILRHTNQDRRVTLQATHTVGRAPTNHLELSSRHVSLHHGCLVWGKDSWSIRDFGSRNGTHINGVRLSSTEAALEQGDRIAFGDGEETWQLADAGPPVPLLTELGSGEEREMKPGEVVGLPSEQDPKVTLYQKQRVWYADADGNTRALRDQEVIELGDRRWRVSLPLSLQFTTTVETDSVLSLSGAELQFTVSADEEWVGVKVLRGACSLTIPTRACLYTLLTLARQRLKDRERGLPPEEAGWVETNQLAHMLATTPQQVNVNVFRVREAFATAGIEEASAIIERLPHPARLRIGVGAFTVDRRT